MEREAGAHGVVAGKVTYAAEGSDQAKSHFFSRHVHWPGGASGVTIGRGYDMGGRTEAQVTRDLKEAGLSDEQAKAFAKGAGLKGKDAQKFVKDNRDKLGTIAPEVQYRLFNAQYPGYAQKAQDQYTKATRDVKDAVPWNDLKPAVKDVAVDFVYQQGSLYKAQAKAIAENDPATLETYIKKDDRANQYEEGRQRVPYLAQRH